jgi:hypothetical protein
MKWNSSLPSEALMGTVLSTGLIWAGCAPDSAASATGAPARAATEHTIAVLADEQRSQRDGA